MKRRSLEEKNENFKSYGGRGIGISSDWLGKFGFINFYNWAMDNGYTDELTIDRKDVNGNYEPNNCRWITMDEQARNKRNTIWLTINNETKTLPEWAEISGVNKGTIWFRVQSGFTGEELIKNTESISGEKWIYWEERKMRWRIRIRIDGKLKSFGTCATLEEAIKKRESILKEHNMTL